MFKEAQLFNKKKNQKIVVLGNWFQVLLFNP